MVYAGRDDYECAMDEPPKGELILKNHLKPVNKYRGGACEIEIKLPKDLNEDCKKLLKRLTRCHPKCRCGMAKGAEVTMRRQFMKNFDSSQEPDISKFKRMTLPEFEDNEDNRPVKKNRID